MTPNVFQRNVAILTLPLLITAIAAPGGNKAYQIRTEAVQKLREELEPPLFNLSDPKSIHRFCQQKLDHFDLANNKTWCQRFVVDARYYQPGGPIFLCIDGEDNPWLPSLPARHLMTCNNMVHLASGRFNALLLGLEHRYYGGSAFDGVETFAVENLKFLSSRQALADAAAFREFIAAHGLNAAPPLDLRDAQWVTFGGSYSGALSAWARQLYPQHFAAAVASSAPMESQMNFQGFHDVVASSLAAPSVFGTPQCLATISRGHAELGDLLKTERGKRSLEKKFNLCGSNPLDVRQNIGGWAGFGVITSNQYNNNRCPTTSCNIKLLCGNLSAFRHATVSDLDALVMLQQHQREEMVAGGNPNAAGCTDISWQSYLDSMKIIDKHSDSTNFFRIWTYQLCTEWGNFITCDEDSNCPFTRGYNDMDLWYNMCLEVYNISKSKCWPTFGRPTSSTEGQSFPVERRWSSPMARWIRGTLCRSWYLQTTTLTPFL